jgi:Tfp pilus assembly protein PilN
VRIWLIVGGLNLAAIAGLVLSCQGVPRGPRRDPSTQLRAVQRRIATSKECIRRLHAQIRAVESKLQGAEALKDHPNWSVLLVCLAESLNDHVILKMCALTPSEPATKEPDRAVHGAVPYRLEIRGFGASVPSVSDFAAALRNTGVFDKVRLLGTNQEPFMTGKAFSFRIECQLGSRDAQQTEAIGQWANTGR